jgi:predicted O-methyltransferase YrrM
MDTRRFRELLPELYDGDVMADHPVDRRFKALQDDVEGMSSENALALLNLAASLLPSAEAYLEVGSYKGLTLSAAMHGNEHASFHAIESFREFGVDSGETKRALLDNVGRWADVDRLTLHVGDAFRLMTRPGLIGSPVGVYFYDGNHSKVAQHLALAVAEPLLADEALVIIDDASWPTVAEPTERYVRRHPGYELLFDLSSERDYEPRWWNGIKVYSYRRATRVRRRPSASTSALRAWYLYAYEPAWNLAWRFLPDHPRLTAFLRRVLPTKGLKQ